MLRTLAKIFVSTAIVLIILLVGAAVFTQTIAFKNTLRASLYKAVENSLNATVYIGDIHGNIITGFQIDTVALYVNNAPFIESGSIALRYDPLPLWRKKVNIVSLELNNPSVTLIKFADSTWNVNRLVKAKAERDSTPSPWMVIAKHLVIRNAHFRLIDSTTLADTHDDSLSLRTLNYSHLDLHSVNIDLSGTYSEREQTVAIHNVSFESPREKFRLDRFSAQIVHTPVLTTVSSLLLATPFSHIELSASASGIDVLDIHDMRELQFIPVEAKIVTSTVASRDIQTFLPSLMFLNGTVFIDARAAGKFSSIDVTRLDCSFNQSALHLKGTVSNLHRPRELFIHGESVKSVIQPSDVPALMPSFSIPDYGDAGSAVLDCTFHGKPLDFHAKGTLETAEGILGVDGVMNLTGRVMTYAGTATGQHVNLKAFFRQPELRSRLNFTARIDGEGSSIGELRTHLDVAVDSSVFYDIPVAHFSSSLTAADKTVKGECFLSSPKGNAGIQGSLDFTEPDGPAYRLTGSVRALDLAAVLKDPYYGSAISFSFAADADRFSLLEANANVRLQFMPSAFGAYMFDSASVSAETRQTAGGKTIRAFSPIADVTLKGDFTFDNVVAAVKAHAIGIRDAYREQRRLFGYAYGDSAVADMPAPVHSGTVQNEPFHIAYTATLKDLKPLSVFFNTASISALGTLEGTIAGDADTLSAEGRIAVTKGSYTQSETPVAVRDLWLTYGLTHMKRDSLFSQQSPMKVDIHFAAKDLRIGATILHSPSVLLNLQGRHGTLAVAGDIDTTMSIASSGTVDLVQPSHHIAFSTLNFRYHGFDLHNLQPVTLTIGETGIKLDSSLFAHGESQLVVYGSLDYGSRLSGAAFLTNFQFPDIRHFSLSPRFRANAALFGGAWDADLLVGGTLRSPTIYSSFRGYDIAYRETKFGTIAAKIEYADRLGDVTCRISHESASGAQQDLDLHGTIPLDLAFIGADNRTGIEGMDVLLTTDNIQMSLFDPFIPEISNVRGILKSSIRLTGSLKDPRFKGGATLHTGSFRLLNNGMTYQAEGKLKLDSTSVTLNEFTLHNLPTDYDAGGAEVDGYVLMKGFAPDEYHLRGRGELMVMQERVRTENRSFFGNLVAATGDDGMRFEGTYERSRLAGVILVRQANLDFPPTAQQSSSSTRISSIVTIDDTSRISADSALALEFINDLDRTFAKAPGFESTFIDGLSYDLQIQTQGNVSVRMIFNANPAAYEELYAELNGRLTLIKEGNNVRLTGTIRVADQSSYTWFKKFSASGSLIFTGPPDNPSLDITAKYDGTHTPAGVANAEDEKVVVTMKITGMRLRPDPIKFTVTRVDKNLKETEVTDDVQNNAVSFLMTSSPGVPGKFREELSNQDRANIASKVGNVLIGSVSGLVSSAIVDFMQRNKIPFVKKIEIRPTGGIGSTTSTTGVASRTDLDMRLSGEVLDAYYTIGGRVLSADPGNMNVSVQYPLGDKARRNFILEVERRVDDIGDNKNSTYMLARLYYRFIF